ncbi:hypothetical protein D3C77_257270 [compost metagenome]
MSHVPLAFGRLHQAAVTGALQFRFRLPARGQHRIKRIDFVRPEQFLGSRYGHRMAAACASFRSDEVVAAIPLINMRGFRFFQRGAVKQLLRLSNQLPLLRIVLLNDDAARFIAFRNAVIPQCIQQPLAAVIVMEQGRIEAAAVQINRLRPRAVDGFSRNQVVMAILEWPLRTLDIRIHEIEQSVMIAELRRPNAAIPRVSLQLNLIRQNIRAMLPFRQVGRFVHSNAWQPFKRGNGNIISVLGPYNTGIRVKARQYRVADHCCNSVIRNQDGSPP